MKIIMDKGKINNSEIKDELEGSGKERAQRVLVRRYKPTPILVPA